MAEGKAPQPKVEGGGDQELQHQVMQEINRLRVEFALQIGELQREKQELQRELQELKDTLPLTNGGNLISITMSIPPFQGRSDPEQYLDWERRVEQVFECHNFSQEKKVNLAAVEFSGYATFWWDQVRRQRVQAGTPPVQSWDEMKEIMRERFVPDDFRLGMLRRLQGLKQGTLTVEEYARELEITLFHAGLQEADDATLLRFLSGLNGKLSDALELCPFKGFKGALQLAIKLERQMENQLSCNSISFFGSKA